jgi:aminopeptidase N
LTADEALPNWLQRSLLGGFQHASQVAQVGHETVAATEEWLAAPERPSSPRRLVAEGKDGVVWALAARAKNAASLQGPWGRGSAIL